MHALSCFDAKGQTVTVWPSVENSHGARDSEALSTSIATGNFAQGLTWAEDVDCSWYAAYTTPCHEKQVAKHLVVRQIEHFLPLYTSIRRWADGRTVTRECPLFPSYVFVQITRQERVKVLSVPGILSLVGTSKGATPLPSTEIETMRSRLHLCHAAPHPFLDIGEKANVRSGPLAGMQGIVLRHDKSTRIVLSLDLIRQSIAVEVDVADLEPAEFRMPTLV
jgi:transcription antitermination factor NusG